METTTYINLGILVWVTCGIINYGLIFAMYQNKWPRLADRDYGKDVLHSFVLAFTGGPITTILIIIHRGYKYGFKLM